MLRNLTRSVIGSSASGPIRQHPPGESAPVIFAEPPSVVGIGGAQIGEGAAGAAAVLLGVCVEVLSRSPGNSSGTCELGEADALIPLMPPATGPAVITDPLTGALPPPASDPFVVAVDVPEENDEVDGSDDVGTLSGSVPPFVVV